MTKFQKIMPETVCFGYLVIETLKFIWNLRFEIWVYSRIPFGTTTIPEAVTVNRFTSSSRL